MPHDIYKSLLTLRYMDKYYEKHYILNKAKNLWKVNLIMSVFLFTVSLGISIYLIIEHISETNSFRFQSTIFCYLTLAVSFMNLLLVIIFKKSENLQLWLSYINYITISLCSMNYRFLFTMVLDIDVILFALLFKLEMIFRHIWFLMACLNFLNGIILQLMSILLNIAILCVFYPFDCDVKHG